MRRLTSGFQVALRMTLAHVFGGIFAAGFSMLAVSGAAAQSGLTQVPSKLGVSSTRASHPIAVFGADERILLPDHLKHLEDKIGLIFEPRTRTVCTAFCLSSRTIATAAHCLFRTRGERPLTFGHILFRLAADTPRRTTRIAGGADGAASQHIVSGATSLSTRPPIDATLDWALVKLAAPACRKGGLPLSTLSPADLRSPSFATRLPQRLYQVGFHGDFGNWRLVYSPPCGRREPNGATLPLHVIREEFTSPEHLILHTCDTGGASSGSPMLVDGENGPEVVGINVGTYLQSRVLTQAGEVVHRYRSDTIANTAVSTLAWREQLLFFDAAQILTDSAAIRRLQAALSATTHYAGAIDGRYGPQTRAAIIAFEVANNLPPTGMASIELLRRAEAATVPHMMATPQAAPTAVETGSIRPPAPRRQSPGRLPVITR